MLRDFQLLGRRERVRERVVWLHGRHLMARHLLVDQLPRALEDGVAVAPVAHRLQRVHKIAPRDGVGRESRCLLHRQRLPVCGDGFLHAPRVLVDGGEVGVGVGEARLQLDRLQVGRDGLGEPAQVLERVSHVGVGVGEGGVVRDGELVLGERLVHLVLLLEEVAQVAVRASKVRPHADGVSVHVLRFPRAPHVAIRVGQVVEGVGVVGVAPQRGLIAANRVLGAPKQLVGVAAVGERIREVGLQRQRAVKRRQARLQHPQLKLRRRQVREDHGVVAAELERRLVLGRRVLQLAAVLQHVAQVRVRRDARWVELDRTAVVPDGLRHVALVLEDARHVGPGYRERGAEPDGGKEAGLCAVDVAEQAVQVAQVHLPARVVRPQAHGVLEMHERLLVVALLQQDAGHVAVHVRERRLEQLRASVVLQRRVQVAAVLVDVANVAQRLRKVGLERDGALAVLERGVKVAQLKVRGAEQEQHVHVVGVGAQQVLAHGHAALVVAGVVRAVGRAEAARGRRRRRRRGRGRGAGAGVVR
mmetsp:Transcript_2411/g.8185  ORF Transcript_2411/g.8185 Transcript_2411/m.8185 type:complete len:531 (-) Transcript_2411:33-1625(-)